MLINDFSSGKMPHLIRMFLSKYLGGGYFYPFRINYCINTKENLVFFRVPKNASNSIIAALGEMECSSRLIGRQKKFKRFAVVRNPFSRIYSCYQNKYAVGTEYADLYGVRSGLRIRIQRLGKADTFKEFVKRVAAIPDYLADPHFTSQYFFICGNRKNQMDFILRFEQLNEDFALMKKQLGLAADIELKHLNAGVDQDWKQRYDMETAALVYQRYKKDFEHWYPEAYAELLDHLNGRTEK